MSFTPLPEALTGILADLTTDEARIVDLGCGDGRLTAALDVPHLWIVGLDRLRFRTGEAPVVSGDVLRPPIKPGSCDLLLAGNLVRHLIQDDPACGFLETWSDLLRPEGTLFILEDEPVRSPVGARMYARLQEFLARVVPRGRGPLIGLAEFRRRLEANGRTDRWRFGGAENRYELDTARVVEMLRGGELDPSGEAAKLADRIERVGLATGRYWWAARTGVFSDGKKMDGLTS